MKCMFCCDSYQSFCLFKCQSGSDWWTNGPGSLWWPVIKAKCANKYTYILDTLHSSSIIWIKHYVLAIQITTKFANSFILLGLSGNRVLGLLLSQLSMMAARGNLVLLYPLASPLLMSVLINLLLVLKHWCV